LLEDRTLLASLQIDGELADISTLGSVTQDEDSLFASGSSITQKYTHTDGKTTSDGTFKTGPSNTTNPGFNLDVLSQGGVDWNGLVSAKVAAGLADADGTIGSAVTVTITGTPAEEGNAVTVYLSFVFDVEDFAWNNATLNLNYSANYTFRGKTSNLASSPGKLLGGEGPGASRPGPVTATAALAADIGDTFTLSFSENLAGQTIAPFTGAGLDNANWTIDANLDASVASAITPETPAFASDGGVDYGYAISGAALPRATTVDLDWASGTTADTVIDDPIRSTTTETAEGSYDLHATPNQLGTPPPGATYLLVVADPHNLVSPADPSKIASLAVSDLWTGDGSDDLWSDSDNWAGGMAPGAGADLVFPNGAQQLTNEDDLGLSFSSIITNDNYEFSASDFLGTSDLTVQQGSLQLDDSATVTGTVSVMSRSSFTVGDGATQASLTVGTLDDDGNLTVAAKAGLTDNTSLTVGTNGSLDDEGTLTVAANATLTNNDTVTVGSHAYLDDEGTITVAPNASLTEVASSPDSPNLTFTPPIVATPPNVELSNGNYGAPDTLQPWSVDTSLVNAVLNAQGYTSAYSWSTSGTTVSLANNAVFNAVSGMVGGYMVNGYSLQSSDGNALDENMHVTLNIGATTVPTAGPGQTVTQHWLQILNEDKQYTTKKGPYGFTIAGQQGFWQIDNGDMTNGTVAGSSGSSPSPFYDKGGLGSATEIADDPSVVEDGHLGAYLHFYDIPVWDVQSATSDTIYLGNTGFTWGFSVKHIGINIGSTATMSDLGSVSVGVNAALFNHGKLSIGATGTLTILGLVEISAGGTLDGKDKILVAASGKLSDQDAITVAAGSTLDVFGNLTEGAGGNLDTFGTVTIEPEAVLDDFSPAVIEAGGILNDEGAATVEAGASLDVVGTLGIAKPGSLDIYGGTVLEASAAYQPLGTVIIQPNGYLGPPVFPRVTTNPKSQVVSAGNPVTFEASAAGLPAPTVQWQLSNDGGTTFTDLAGATSIALTFTTTAAENGNEYRAAFSDSSGTATTAPATLTVNTQQGGLVISAANGVFPHFNLQQPPQGAGSVGFGLGAVVLNNGNIVVTAAGPPEAYLYNGRTGALISVFTGTGVLGFTVIPLTNGNYVLAGWSQGTATATWASGTTGISGTVSTANSLVAAGGVSSDSFKVIPLANGNYVADFVGWDGRTGAVTWGNGTKGTVGIVSAANSLVGSNFGDDVGDGNPGVTALTNGNYVVISPSWNNGDGAVTWGNGAAGVNGMISSANSLIGYGGLLAVTPLPDGNYVVADSEWNRGQGVVTWGNGTTGVVGVVSADNSLVGSYANDQLGHDVVVLTNGNFVISGFGTATWASGASATSGTVSADNSLVGGDVVDYPAAVSVIAALTNGNYVVDFPGWTNGAGLSGAVTWGNGTTGTTGTVAPDNSLVGSDVGYTALPGSAYGGGVTALANGNYAVASPGWNRYAGAVTWGNGSTGTIGVVSASNSLVGTHPFSSGSTFSDQVGSDGVTALANGNYVVESPQWFGNTGAVTWGNGATGSTVGAVTTANSLVGGISGDFVGEFGVTALSNGNYVVSSPYWNDSLDGVVKVGAVTWGDGTKGVAGAVSSTNSLVGSSPDDEVGYRRVIALPNGNYVVESLLWNQQAGALTWGNGTTGVSGTVSTTNSFTKVDSPDGGIVTLPNSNYFFWNGDGGGSDTWFDGSSGTTLDGQNTPDRQNSFSGGFLGSTQMLPSGNVFVAGTTVATTDPNDLTYALGEGQTITVTPGFLTRTLNAGIDVTLQSNDDITIDSPITEAPTATSGTLTLEAGRSILINAGISTVGGNLSLIANETVADGVINSERDAGDADIAMASGATIDTGSGSLLVDLKQSTDKTNNGRGTVTLHGITASTFTLAPGSTLDVAIKGTTPGDGVTAGTYSQLAVSGSIDLDNATLQVVTSTAVSAGTKFTIVQSVNGVTGAFDGLPEGSLVAAAGGSEFTISYHGDGGDAVVLTALGMAPDVTGVSPWTGPTTGGTDVTINGANFSGATAVKFGNAAAANITVVSSTEITADSPSGAGVVDVTVITPVGTSVTSPNDQFTYLAIPTVTRVRPNSGLTVGGTLVTITGTNLLDATSVDFGTTTVTSFSSDTASQIILLSPAGSGAVDVTVVTSVGTSATSSADQFRYFTSQSLPTSLSAVSGSGTSGGTATLTSTLATSAGPLAGRTVKFTLTDRGTVAILGTATTDANGVATLTGVSLVGLDAGTYPGALGASFAGDSTYAVSSASGTLVVKTPAPLLIIGEQSLFRRRTNKKGKPIGNSVLTGFVFDFSEALNPSSATSNTNYQVDTIATKRLKKQTRRIVHPITGFSVAYSVANDSVTLTFAGKQTFRTGGQLTVVGGPPAGVIGVSGAALTGSTVFTISRGGRTIVAQ
jgi:hypothetical protein